MPKLWWIGGALTMAAAAVLPLVGHWMRRSSGDRCRVDGQPIRRAFAVTLIDSNGESHAFCGLQCAEIWLEKTKVTPRVLTVTDESSGKPIDASAANYARSPVVSNDITRDRRHVFADRDQAARHVDQFGGKILDPSQRPFRRYTRSKTHTGQEVIQSNPIYDRSGNRKT